MHRMAIAALFAALLAPLGAAAHQRPTINTRQYWQEGAEYPFGRRYAWSNAGEVITIPDGMTHLNAFSFWLHKNVVDRHTCVVRGEVYRWDGSEATGESLYESRRRLLYYHDDTDWHEIRFRPASLAVEPGAQYVLFMTVDKDYSQCHVRFAVMGAMDDNLYPGGTFVALYSLGHEDQWTTVPWETDGTDLAFKAYLSP